MRELNSSSWNAMRHLNLPPIWLFCSSMYMVESAFDWDDVGEWPAIERHYKADEHGNVAHGTMITQNSSGNKPEKIEFLAKGVADGNIEIEGSI